MSVPVRLGLVALPLLFLALVAAERRLSQSPGVAAGLRADSDALLLLTGALCGGLMAGALFYALLPRIVAGPDKPEVAVPFGRSMMLALGFGVCAGWLLGPLLFATAGAWTAGVVTVAALLALGAALALREAVRQLRAGASLRVESHWGGIGGAAGGWELSPPAGLLLLALLLGTASLGALQALRPAPPAPASAASAPTVAPAGASVTTTTTTTTGAPPQPRAAGN